ncbi:UNVERIFIED_CONTAM: putative carboxylesterase 17 [Sesamum radiatum]|uniref:Carboxylesterase 17 n=1 Tax=Sesamum radiatum TaxID=300843 RepID=A0AAW2II63_SESRA
MAATHWIQVSTSKSKAKNPPTIESWLPRLMGLSEFTKMVTSNDPRSFQVSPAHWLRSSGLRLIPLMVYFHGGGFCVGSASWSCYHEFLAKLASRLSCAVVSVNYRLAPENPLPAAYDDGVKALVWLTQQNFVRGNDWWTSKCDFSSIFLAGDSAGANIAYNVALRPPRSALTLAARPTYWRLSLPSGANRDHPWCNPAAKGAEELRSLRVMVCISEMDILRDRNLELCGNLRSKGVKVEEWVCKGVGHAFQFNKSALSQSRVLELICHINNFMGR